MLITVLISQDALCLAKLLTFSARTLPAAWRLSAAGFARAGPALLSGRAGPTASLLDIAITDCIVSLTVVITYKLKAKKSGNAIVSKQLMKMRTFLPKSLKCGPWKSTWLAEKQT